MPFLLCHLVLRQISSIFLPARSAYSVLCLQSNNGQEEAKNHALPLPHLKEFTALRKVKPKMNGLFLGLLKGSISKVLQGELIFSGVGLQWVWTARRSEASLKQPHRWVMKLGGLSAPSIDTGIYIQLERPDLEKSTVHSAMDLTASCSFPKRFSQIFSRGIFSI